MERWEELQRGLEVPTRRDGHWSPGKGKGAQLSLPTDIDPSFRLDLPGVRRVTLVTADRRVFLPRDHERGGFGGKLFLNSEWGYLDADPENPFLESSSVELKEGKVWSCLPRSSAFQRESGAKLQLIPQDLGWVDESVQSLVRIQVSAADLTARRRGLLSLDTHPRPRCRSFELTPQQTTWEWAESLSLQDLPPVRRGRLRARVFLEGQGLGSHSLFGNLAFQRPTLQRSHARARGVVTVWRSDGQPVDLEANCPGGQVRLEGNRIEVVSGAGSLFVRDRRSSMQLSVPIVGDNS